MQYKECKRMREIDALYNEYDAICHEVSRKQGLSDSAYDVLRTLLVLGEGSTQTAVCKNGYLNKQTINSAVKKLLADGILSAKQGKGRETLLFFTEKGREIVERNVLPFENAETEVYDAFSEEEYQTFIRLTRQYVELYREKVQNLLEEK